MKIESSDIKMTSMNRYSEETKISETTTFWKGGRGPSELQDNLGNSNNASLNIQISQEAKEKLEAYNYSKVSGTEETQNTSAVGELTEEDKNKIQLIEQFIYQVTGKKVKLKIMSGEECLANCKSGLENTSELQQQTQQSRRAGWGMVYEYHESYHEKASMSFESTGTIKTADGREIEFDFGVNMSREFASSLDISFRAGDAKKIDPLVLNFNGTAAQLTQTKFEFDLDADGTAENISFVDPDSGFLVLDKNGNGLVDDGTELFGPSTGSGYGELSDYDSDGNNWIDENDEIFNSLQIWMKDDNGNDKLMSLGQKGVGAIYLGNVATDYTYKTSNNEALGNVKNMGIYLNENGTAGAMAEVDFMA